MRKIALAQINPILGDFKGNAKKIIQWIHQAKDQGVDLVVFPECALFGYHPFDLLERCSVVEEQIRALDSLPEKMPEGIAALIGVISFNKSPRGRRYHNSAALVVRSRKPKIFHKQLLPTEDVFDEGRFIEPGNLENNFFTYKGRRIFVCICEDIWAWDKRGERNPYRANPLSRLKGEEVDLVVNLSASPFYLGKQPVREELVRKTARLFDAPTFYANLVGAQDEVVYDGGSFAYSQRGKKLIQCKQFEEDLGVFDFESGSGDSRELITDDNEYLRRAIVTALSDYGRKVGLSRVHLGLSGGIDSALVCALAVDAFGAENVSGIALPTEFNSPDSLRLAKELAENFGIHFVEFPIQESYEILNRTIQERFANEGFGLPQENLQARVRGTTLMAFSNIHNSLLLSTSNKSEMACGYSTLYGDMNGGLAPIGDLTKGQVYSLSEHYNADKEMIPRGIIDRPPSAELRPDQVDQDSLPPYDVLDRAVEKIVVHAEKATTKVDRWLLGQLMRTEFKRWQAPPIVKLSRHAFGRGRRYPIAHHARV